MAAAAPACPTCSTSSIRRTSALSVGEPVALKHKSLAADTKRIMRAIAELLPPEAHVRHVPTPDELAATYPPGYKGDPEHRDSAPARHRLTGQSPTAPSIDWRSRSACPQWRAYSSIMWTSIHRSEITRPT